MDTYTLPLKGGKESQTTQTHFVLCRLDIVNRKDKPVTGDEIFPWSGAALTMGIRGLDKAGRGPISLEVPCWLEWREGLRLRGLPELDSTSAVALDGE